MRFVEAEEGLRRARRTEKFTFWGMYPVFATATASNLEDLRWPALQWVRDFVEGGQGTIGLR